MTDIIWRTELWKKERAGMQVRKMPRVRRADRQAGFWGRSRRERVGWESAE